jgi:hypothetical protein
MEPRRQPARESRPESRQGTQPLRRPEDIAKTRADVRAIVNRHRETFDRLAR